MNKKNFVNLHHSRVPEQKKVMKRITKDGVCPFCTKNLQDYHTKPILKKGMYWIVTENAWPYDGIKLQILFIHKKHIESVEKLGLKDWAELLELTKWVVKKHNIQGGGFYIRFGNTDYTTGTVSHLHANIITGEKRSKNAEKIRVSLGYQI